MSTHSLAGHVAVVTGGGSGVGREIAIHLARCDATVYVLGRRLSNLEETARLAGEHSGRVHPYAVDISDEGAVEKFREAVGSDSRSVAVLVHSAGVFSRGSVQDAPIGDLDAQYRSNLRGPWVLTQALLPLIKTARGQIVFVNSSAGHAARAEVGQYAATKHGLRALADSLREEVNALGIRVLSIYLGRTATPMQASVHQMEGKPYHPEALIQPSDVASVVLHMMALPRTIEVTDASMRPLVKS